MKKVSYILLSIIMLFSVLSLSVIAAQPETFTSGDYEYKVLEDGTVEIEKYKGTDASVNIPGELDGKKVSALSMIAFKNNEALTSVVIPEGITTARGFSGCEKLESVSLPAGLKEIGWNGFTGCVALEEIKIPEGVTTICPNAFGYCDNLKKVELPSTLKTIDFSAFWFCNALESIEIPDSITTIGYQAFFKCTALETIKMSENANIQSLGRDAFYETKYTQTESNWTDGFLYLGNCLLSVKEDAVEVIIREGTRLVDPEAFRNCKSVTRVEIPESLVSLGDYPLAECTALREIYVEDGNTKYFAMDNVLYEKATMTLLNYPNGKDNKVFIVPSFTKSIASLAFAGNPYLNEVILHENLKWIGYNAFYNCVSMKRMEIPANTQVGEECGIGLYYVGSDAFTGDVITNVIPGFVLTITKDSSGEYYRCCWNFKNVVVRCKDGHDYQTTAVKTPATTTKRGVGEKTCSECGLINKDAAIGKIAKIGLSATAYTYDATVKTPTVIVKDEFGNTLKNGTDYTVKYASGRKRVGKYAVKVTFKGQYAGTKTLYFTINLGKPSKVSASQTANEIKLSWSTVKGATGYRVYTYDAKTKKYTKLANTKANTYTVKKLKAGTEYKFAVRAYFIDGKEVVWSNTYQVITASTRPGTPTLSAAAGTKKASLKWNKQTGATGYVVYMATSKTGKYSKIATLKGNSAVSFTKTGLTKGKTYYFKVATYKTVGSSNLYGSFSAVKAVKVK